MRGLFSLLVIAALLLLGCSAPTTPVDQLPLDFTPPLAHPGELPIGPAPRPPEVAVPRPVDGPGAASVRLVPLPAEPPISFKTLYPEGWTVQVSTLGDSVQIVREPIHIDILTLPLRESEPPKSTEEMWHLAKSWAPPDLSISPVTVSGADYAYRLQYTRNGGDTTAISLYLYGSTYSQTLLFRLPTESLPEWEPIISQIIGWFQPSDLNRVPLPTSN